MRWLIALLAVSVPVAASAETVDESIYNCKPRDAAVEITFKPEIELKELLSWAVGFTCKKFVFDPRIVSTGRKVTLVAPGKQTPAQAYDMFTTALGTLGLTVVPKGRLLEIVESAVGKTKTPPIYAPNQVPTASEQIVRYLMRPQYAQPETMRQAVTAFKSDAGDVQVIGSLVLVTDHASNIRDMASIAKLIDVPGGADGIYAIPVKHADASKLAEKLGQLLDVSAGASIGRGPTKGDQQVTRDTTQTPSKLLVDERTNTLIVSGTDAAFQRVKALVERLDISLEIEGGASMHVYQLGSAISEELAKTLNDAIQAQTQSGQGDKKAPPGTASGDLTQLEGPVRVISDKPTNKLIVMSSGRDFLAIREVIRELDVPRRQVYIEAMILEVQMGNGLSLGTSSHGGLNYGADNSSLLIGGVQAPSLKSTNLETLTGASGLIGGLLGKTLPGSEALFGKSIPSYAVLFQALADTSRMNILSTMPLIVVDNEQAKYKLGTNVPYIKGVMPTSVTNTQLTTNIDRKDLLLELEIKPHISTDDSVLLEVRQASEDLGDSNSQLGPSWSTRSIETRVLVRDQQTIVLGGLIQNREQIATSKVPLLGDIPILGHLFKYTSKSQKKMNLLVMLTPYIVKDNLDLENIRARKQREYEEFAGSFRHLDGQKYLPRIDYTRKRGVVEEINRIVLDIEAETAARGKLHTAVSVSPGLVEPARFEAEAPDDKPAPEEKPAQVAPPTPSSAAPRIVPSGFSTTGTAATPRAPWQTPMGFAD
ncbi:MAG TPA: type II secretion system secretin GspD [Kofleriaceae bacterium]|nr:type II secretion system secretin GspD [Kofleriaceae bacterium]